MYTMSGIHLVLDLDGTLVGTTETDETTPRPFLKEFLAYCFAHCSSVSIWTAASRGWWNLCYDAHIAPLMQSEWKFACIMTGIDCDIVRQGGYYSFIRDTETETGLIAVKPLRKLWNVFNVVRPENTIIIDDTPETSLRNVDNYIRIPRYKSDADDICLLTIMGQLQLISELLVSVGDVREIKMDKCPPVRK
jgi:hypothetical protein